MDSWFTIMSKCFKPSVAQKIGLFYSYTFPIHFMYAFATTPTTTHSESGLPDAE